MKRTRLILAFIFAVLICSLLTSIIGTQLVLADIMSFGLDVSFTDRVSATTHDIVGLAPVLSILITTTLFIAFLVAAGCNRYLGGNRTYWYLAAGFVSLPASLILIKLFMGATLFAAARSGTGMLLFALCGLVGGGVFARLTQKKAV
jgi:hypothetical protein